ncbi:hypothetical protein KBY82_09545 [Cyanobium sp. AMD-g]|uniref:glycosyl transferase family 90 n=1 Tax=Cyanobium sp. AMD-g TaxID=2823699 RepID=UPI0020CE4CF0|nr:glycosyl transferase family 90 [Cyanobium sp. AMD-g]MCP9931028.1 hypothetical protein [Cyanobium sp. AMD-g]
MISEPFGAFACLSKYCLGSGVDLERYVSQITTEELLGWLTLRFQVCPSARSDARLLLAISTQLPLDNQDILKRVSLCISCWLPTILRVAEKCNSTDLSLLFSCHDLGDPFALSMDSETWNNLIPDLYSATYAVHHSLQPLPSFNQFKCDYQAKTPIAFWRGSSTGSQSSSLDELMENPRVKICVRQIPSEYTDMKITRIVQVVPEIEVASEGLLRQHGILGSHVDEKSFGGYRFYLDLPGNACAWGSFMKYLQGCLVLRPQTGRNLLYYEYTKPWYHYIPLEADCSDLDEKIGWCLRNSAKSMDIAYRGLVLMSQYLHMIPQLTERAVAKWIQASSP